MGKIDVTKIEGDDKGTPMDNDDSTLQGTLKTITLNKPFDKNKSLILMNNTDSKIYWEKDKKYISYDSNELEIGQEIEIENINQFVHLGIEKGTGQLKYSWR